MPAFEDDDLEDFRLHDGARRGGGGGGGAGGESNDDWDDPDERDLVPDEMETVRCTNCRKWILEETVRCPYCKEMQLEDARGSKPLWFVLAVILGLLATLTWFFFGTPSWFHL